MEAVRSRQDAPSRSPFLGPDFVQIDRDLVQLAVEALESAKKADLRVVTAELCTGGLIATVLSEAPGAAQYLAGGFVTYTPEQKCVALNLDAKLIEKYGAVSAEVADAMTTRKATSRLVSPE